MRRCQSFEISGIPFTVIRRFQAKRGRHGHVEIQDQTILIPYSVAPLLYRTENVKQIYFRCASMDEVTEPQRDQRIVQARHRPGSAYTTQTLRKFLTTAARVARQSWTACCFLVFRCHADGGRCGHHEHHAGQWRPARREIGIPQGAGAITERSTVPVPWPRRYHFADGRIVRTICRGWLCRCRRVFTNYKSCPSPVLVVP